MINKKYHLIFKNNSHYNRTFKYTNLSELTETFIVCLIKKKHILESINFLTAINSLSYNCIKFSNNNRAFRYKSPSVSTCFLYNLLKNKNILKKVCQIKCEPNILVMGKAGLLRLDFFMLIDVNNTLVPLFLEFDDYTNSETLSGGHSDPNRKIRDILKDVYCWILRISLIRLKYNENIFDILEKNVLNNTNFPIYKFYDSYFDNKIK